MSLYQVDEELVKKEIAKLKPINYTPYRWWRNFKQDIPKNNGSLRERFKAGEYEFSSYYWMAKLVEIEINKIYNDCYPDMVKFNEKAALLKAKRTRLLIDFEKEETKRLNELEKIFTKNFKVSKDLYYDISEKHEGTLYELFLKFSENMP